MVKNVECGELLNISGRGFAGLARCERGAWISWLSI
jgi:hypothetical protein